ncbi:hypothetical protein FQZ97_1172200 [compost metagenome]
MKRLSASSIIRASSALAWVSTSLMLVPSGSHRSTRISGRDDCGKKFFGMNWNAHRLMKKATSVIDSTMTR